VIETFLANWARNSAYLRLKGPHRQARMVARRVPSEDQGAKDECAFAGSAPDAPLVIVMRSHATGVGGRFFPILPHRSSVAPKEFDAGNVASASAWAWTFPRGNRDWRMHPDSFAGSASGVIVRRRRFMRPSSMPQLSVHVHAWVAKAILLTARTAMNPIGSRGSPPTLRSVGIGRDRQRAARVISSRLSEASAVARTMGDHPPRTSGPGWPAFGLHDTRPVEGGDLGGEKRPAGDHLIHPRPLVGC
jgi:hypothetical protein